MPDLNFKFLFIIALFYQRLRDRAFSPIRIVGKGDKTPILDNFTFATYFLSSYLLDVRHKNGTIK